MPKKEKEDKILTEIKRHNKVLMEHMEKQVGTIAEQHDSVRKEIKQLRNSMENRFATVEMAVLENSKDIKELKTDVKEIKQKLDSGLSNHEQRITKTEEKVGI